MLGTLARRLIGAVAGTHAGIRPLLYHKPQ